MAWEEDMCRIFFWETRVRLCKFGQEDENLDRKTRRPQQKQPNSSEHMYATPNFKKKNIASLLFLKQHFLCCVARNKFFNSASL